MVKNMRVFQIVVFKHYICSSYSQPSLFFLALSTSCAILICSAAPLRKRPNFVRHEKKWMRRKRLKMERRYLRLEEGVNELKAYIKFKQDNKPNW